jgi:hypothetical protein
MGINFKKWFVLNYFKNNDQKIKIKIILAWALNLLMEDHGKHNLLALLNLAPTPRVQGFRSGGTVIFKVLNDISDLLQCAAPTNEDRAEY